MPILTIANCFPWNSTVKGQVEKYCTLCTNHLSTNQHQNIWLHLEGHALASLALVHEQVKDLINAGFLVKIVQQLPKRLKGMDVQIIKGDLLLDPCRQSPPSEIPQQDTPPLPPIPKSDLNKSAKYQP